MQAIITLRIDTDSYSNETLRCNASTGYDLMNFTEFPNPHLWHHDCWSKAKAEITKNIANNNYELVVMQIIAAVQSVNVAEAPSFLNGFLNDFNSSRIVSEKNLFHVIDNDGNTYNYAELVAHEVSLTKTETPTTTNITVPELTDISEMPEAPINLNRLEETPNTTPVFSASTEYTQVEIEDDGSEW